MTEYLLPDDVLELAYGATGIEPSVRDYGLLYSAVARPQAGAFGEDAYSTILEKAAALLHSLCRNHPFVDGNKRTAWISTATFCRLNGVLLRASTDEMEQFILAVATGELDEVGEITKQLSEFVSE